MQCVDVHSCHHWSELLLLMLPPMQVQVQQQPHPLRQAHWPRHCSPSPERVQSARAAAMPDAPLRLQLQPFLTPELQPPQLCAVQ